MSGHAHSVECWLVGELAGGLYGFAVANTKGLSVYPQQQAKEPFAGAVAILSDP